VIINVINKLKIAKYVKIQVYSQRLLGEAAPMKGKLGRL
jgi:hypothetical protein